MIGKVLLFGIAVAGIACALVSAQRHATREQLLDKDAKNRWESEGGPAAPNTL